MKRKNKFMTAILSQNEWILIKKAMENLEPYFYDKLTFAKVAESKKVQKYYQKLFNITHHFNSVSIANIEDLADKIEKQRRKEKRSEKKETQIHKGKESHSK